MSFRVYEHCDTPIDINAHLDSTDSLRAVTYTANGEYLMSGGTRGIYVWRVDGGEQMATIEAPDVQCLAVSKDGKWIAAGTNRGDVFIWDMKTHKLVFRRKESLFRISTVVDFSPDSTQIVVVSHQGTAAIWDIASHVLEHGTLDLGFHGVIAAKYSPEGDRIATANPHSVRIYDSKDSRLLVDADIKVTPLYNTGLVWFKNHLFLVSENKIKQINATTGAMVSEWLVPDADSSSCIALPQHGEFVAYSTNRIVTFWDMSTHAQLGLIQHPQDIYSIALSPDGQFIAIGGEYSRTTTRRLFRIVEPEIKIEDTVLDCWKSNQLESVETYLTAKISAYKDPDPRLLASRALVRARLQQWDTAIEDAEKAIQSHPSVFGYIAKSVALIGNGKKQDGFRTCDTAFEYLHSTHVTFHLLIKAIIVFMGGEHDDAISRVDDLIATVHLNSPCYVVQAYMYFLLGNTHMQHGHCGDAIRSFRCAQDLLRGRTSQGLSMVSLIFGWKFDNLSITIQQHLSDALYAAGRTMEASELVLQMVHHFRKEVYLSGAINWVSDFTKKCLGNSEIVDEDAATFNLPTLASLLGEWARAKLAGSSWNDALNVATGFVTPRFMVYRAICLRLEAIHRILDATTCFCQMSSELGGEIEGRYAQFKWISDFKRRCSEKLVYVGDAEAAAQRYDPAITHYSAAFSLNPANPRDIFIKRSKARVAIGLWKDALDDVNEVVALDPSSSWNHDTVLTEWGEAKLADSLWTHALIDASCFPVHRFPVYRAICERLEMLDRMTEAIECFHQMESDSATETDVGADGMWVLEFRRRCPEKLMRLGDAAMESRRHAEAVKHYSAALSFHQTGTQNFLITRSKICMANGSWEDALNDANEVVARDPSSPWGYKIKYMVLHEAGRYVDAIDAFKTMLLKISHSCNPTIHECLDRYVNPSSTIAVIHRIVQRTIRHSPRILINTTTGRLQNKTQQALAFMSLPIVNELVSSMTTRIDRGRIKREVKQFFRYVTLLHKWEEDEPLYKHVMHVAVYDLDRSPTHDKLQTFCKLVRDAGFNWAWSDTCCIDKQDHFVLQEALVAMFRWYHDSAMTIVFLRGVRSSPKPGDLGRSVWNTRAWTLQEYVAAKIIRFYTEDWTPYLSSDIFNHKESAEVILEMERATGVSAQHLMALRPGLSSIREKLCLASTRQTTMVEDAAYSLLGIFSVTGIPAIYGEGESALGRLLAHVLSDSGDTSILAWTGECSKYNSCLPARITSFSQSATSYHHVPLGTSEVDEVVSRTSVDLDVALKLYDRLRELPAPWFVASRMKLPCIAFKLPPLSPYRTRAGRIYRTDTLSFGMVEIKTRQDPSRLNSLYLVLPWLDTLLDREDVQNTAVMEDDIMEPSSDREGSDDDMEDDSMPFSGPSSPSLSPPPPVLTHTTVPAPRETNALRLVARLRRPLDGLLLTLSSTRRRTVVYRRVAADCMVTVQLRESFSLSDVLDNVRVLDVL